MKWEIVRWVLMGILVVFMWGGDPFTIKLLITLGIITQEVNILILKRIGW